jgi:hypothetical protein
VQNLIEPKGDFIAADDDGEIKPLQDMQHMSDDYGDFAWMPEPADAEPGSAHNSGRMMTSSVYARLPHD